MNGSSDPEPWDVDYVNEEFAGSVPTIDQADRHRHIQSFAEALSISDTQAVEGDILSPSSPRSPPQPSLDAIDGDPPPTTWKYGPDNGVLSSGSQSGRGRVEKLVAASDFAVSLPFILCFEAGLTFPL